MNDQPSTPVRVELPRVQMGGWPGFWRALARLNERRHAEEKALAADPATLPPIVYGQGAYRHDGNGRLIDREA